ncbi:hypothetical protein psal_cds_331 [Pandoravirus salinus]|uniref:Uncharacterized protein n=1 Tax=Pandoravirus salinus TaxID=1349410 RepID=S4VU08_9VIRU|nr:hypothetical protein psal_cds_331 [Pandoravirus salinus]AGO83964.1 hypothetical protein psal_cds_331 [Pandoravirus salinus]
MIRQCESKKRERHGLKKRTQRGLLVLAHFFAIDKQTRQKREQGRAIPQCLWQKNADRCCRDGSSDVGAADLRRRAHAVYATRDKGRCPSAKETKKQRGPTRMIWTDSRSRRPFIALLLQTKSKRERPL